MIAFHYKQVCQKKQLFCNKAIAKILSQYNLCMSRGAQIRAHFLHTEKGIIFYFFFTFALTLVIESTEVPTNIFLTVAHAVEDGRSRPQRGLKEAANAAPHTEPHAAASKRPLASRCTVDPYPYYLLSTGGPLIGQFLGQKKQFLTAAHAVEDGRSCPQRGLKEAATAAPHAAPRAAASKRPLASRRTVDPYPYYLPSTGGPLIGRFLAQKKQFSDGGALC
jgi:hypothetical protein